MKRDDNSVVDDALVRVLADAYEIARCGSWRENKRSNHAVAKDEKILRDALFGKSMTGDK